MATFVPAVNCAEVTVNGSQSGWPCQFGIAAEHDGVITSPDIDDLLEIFDTWISESLLSVMCPGAIVNNVAARDLTTEDSFDISSVIDEPGTGSGDCLPAQVSVCITKRTSLSGRSRRGRMYLYGVRSDLTSDTRHLTSGGLASYNLVANSLTASFVSTEWTPVVLSRVSAGVPRVTALITPITFMECRDTRLDTQRRRLGRS